MATVSYCSVVASICRACIGHVVPISVAVMLMGALVGATSDNQPFRVLAGILLPQPVFNAVRINGVHSGACCWQVWGQLLGSCNPSWEGCSPVGGFGISVHVYHVRAHDALQQGVMALPSIATLPSCFCRQIAAR